MALVLLQNEPSDQVEKFGQVFNFLNKTVKVTMAGEPIMLPSIDVIVTYKIHNHDDVFMKSLVVIV